MEGVRARRRDDAGGIIVGWLTKLVVVGAVVGVVAFDAVSIGVSRLAVEDDGALAAREASTDLGRTRSVQSAYTAALSAATEANPLNEVPPQSFEALPDGTVRLVVGRDATTFVVHRIGWIADWAHVEAHVEGHPLP
ncbi:hypothetical protein ACFP6A_09170 [Quadrisphaera sp. GCM10027208]|uniref:hypothetical protein n=1 Tax=Quadrisphaera sp. GCM10027208 TaxID=3273423 RepID=UPI00362283C6|nr:hypothetical protein HJG43_00095 [Kineosporiaceae bacterium SCSIO 59966]